MRALLLLVLCVVSSTIVDAQVPDPDNCTIYPFQQYAVDCAVTVPYEGTGEASWEVEVTIRDDQYDPIPGATVWWYYDALVNAGKAVVWDEESLTATTDANGVATFNLNVSAYLSGGPEGIEVLCEVGGESYVIAEFVYARSPDADMSGCVDLPDFISFQAEFQQASCGYCEHDYDMSGSVVATDFVRFGAAWGSCIQK